MRAARTPRRSSTSGTRSSRRVSPATARVDADVSAGGEELAAADFDLASVDAAEEGEAETRASRIGNLLWLVIVVAVILFNVLGQLRDGG